MKSNLLTIGEISKRTGVSVKSFRYYDSIGLLKPVYVDPNTSYRYYNFEQTRLVDLIQICVHLSIPLKDVKELIFKNDNSVNYKYLMEYGKKIIKEKMDMLNENLNFLNTFQEDVERINSYNNDESKEFNIKEKYYYIKSLYENEINDNYYKLLENLFEECFSKDLSVKHDYGVIIRIEGDKVTKFIACEVDKKDCHVENVIKIKENTFLCKKTNEFNLDKICEIFSYLDSVNKTIIISPGYTYDFSNSYFEAKCSL